jgi:hypothetical protein
MTGPQASYLETLAREAGQPKPDDMTKAEASKRIDELQDATDRAADDRPWICRPRGPLLLTSAPGIVVLPGKV